MPVNLTVVAPDALHPVNGVRLGYTEAAIKKPGNKDLLAIVLDAGRKDAGGFTPNRFCAAPVTSCKEHLNKGSNIRALVVNPGNANAGTGEEGLARARSVCTELARLLDVSPDQVLPFSTGVIMEPLPVERIVKGLPSCV